MTSKTARKLIQNKHRGTETCQLGMKAETNSHPAREDRFIGLDTETLHDNKKLLWADYD